MENFSQGMSEILSLSREEARRLHSKCINPEHLLLGIISRGKNAAVDILNKFNVDIASIKERIEERCAQPITDETEEQKEVELGFQTAKILRLSTLEARHLKENTDAEHILLGILREKENIAAGILEENDVTYSRVMEAIKNMKPDITSGFGFTDPEEEEDSAPGKSYNMGKQQFGNTGTRTEKQRNDTPVLDNFGTDITRAASEGKLDPVVGREKEIERISQILSRRKKNNPILIGEPGVGKLAIVEGLAQRIIERKTSRTLFDKRSVALDMTAVVAGTK